MTSDDSPTVARLVRLGRALREVGRAQEELWARLARADPDPRQELHREPTVSGRRPAGSRLPDERSPST